MWALEEKRTLFFMNYDSQTPVEGTTSQAGRPTPTTVAHAPQQLPLTAHPPESTHSEQADTFRDADAAQSPPQASGWRYTFASLSNRNYRYLWLGMLLLMGGVQMDMLAVGYLVYELTASALRVGATEAAAGAVMLALGLFAGAVADRFERKRIIQMSQVAASLNALFVASSIVTGTVTWLHLLGAFMFHGVLFAFMIPARQALIPQLVGKEQLSNAIALDAAAMSVTTMVAPAAAGLLYVTIGPVAWGGRCRPQDDKPGSHRGGGGR